MREWIKRSFFALIYWLGFFHLVRWLNRKSVVVLTYHGVLSGLDEVESILHSNFVSAEAFARQMDYVRTHYRPMALREFVENVVGRKPLPDYAVVITFDDGLRNNYTVAYPILKERGMPLTIFLATAFIGRGQRMLWTERVRWGIYRVRRPSVELTVEGQVRRYPCSTQEERERTAEEIVRYLKTLSIDTRNQALISLETVLPSPSNLDHLQPERYDFLNWEEVVEMSKKGVEFGSHTANHAILSVLDDTTVIEEIQNSKTQIEAVLQKECSCFSYPNGARGDFGDREKALLRKAGYTCAVAQIGGLNFSETDPFEIVRINITRGHDFYTFVAALTGTLFFLKKVIKRVD